MEYIDSNRWSLLDWKKNQRRHHRSLHLIQVQPPRIDNAKPVSFTPAFRKLEAKRFLQAGNSHAERNREIKRSNLQLMQRLIEISATRPRSLSSLPKSRSLNTVQRKLTAEKVAAENCAIAGRLEAQSSRFSCRQWSDDYSRTLKYKKQLAKPHCLPTLEEPKVKASRCGSEI